MSPNVKTAFDFLVAKGLTDFQAAGIIGNLQSESGKNLDPTIYQKPTGPGRGIAQWEVGGRWDTAPLNVVSYAAQTGLDPWSLELQLDFLWQELLKYPSFGLAALRATTNVADAATVFMNQFERPKSRDPSARIANAQVVLKAYGIVPPVQPPSSANTVLWVIFGAFTIGVAGVLIKQHRTSSPMPSRHTAPVRWQRRPVTIAADEAFSWGRSRCSRA